MGYREGLAWLALASAFSPVLADLAQNLIQDPADRSSLLAPLWVALCAASFRGRGPSLRSGVWLILAGVALECLGITGDIWTLARLGLPIAVIGMARYLGRPDFAVAALALWLVPIPDAFYAMTTPWLESAFAQASVAVVEAFGAELGGAGPLLLHGDLRLEFKPVDGGLGLAYILVGLGWYAAVRRGRGWFPLLGYGLLALIAAAPLQWLTGVVSVGLLALGFESSAHGLLRYGVWAIPSLGVMFAVERAARRGAQDADRPFFQVAPETGEGDRPRRLLLLSYHFPPGGAAGALRWQELSRYAVDRNFVLDVITLDPADLDAREPSRLDRLPAGTRVFGVADPALPLEHFERWAWRTLRWLRPRPARPAQRSTAAASQPTATRTESLGRAEMRWPGLDVRSWRRAYYAVAEYSRHRAWARDAADLAVRLARANPYAAVISSGPPHLIHAASRWVSQTVQIPFVVDMRDPWSQVERLPEVSASSIKLWLGERQERWALRDAALVVANTDPLRRALSDKYPGSAERIVTVMNGFDDEPVASAPVRDRFMIAYAGTIYLDRSPENLFRACARVVHELHLAPEQFGVEFMGDVRELDGVPMEAIAARCNFEDYLKIHPPGPRRAAMEFLASASLLVVLPQDSHLAIPSKVFEYMRFAAWVLALADPRSATATLLDRTHADVVSADDVDAMSDGIRRRYQAFAAGECAEPIAADPRFSRRTQAQRFLDALERAIFPANSDSPAA